MLQLAFVGATDRNSKMWNAMNKIGGVAKGAKA